MLTASVLQQGLQALVDTPPPNEDEAVRRHAAVFRVYMEGLAPVFAPAGTAPLSLAHAAAERAFVGAARGQALSFTPVQLAYAAYAAALAPAPGVWAAATPPVGLPPIASPPDLSTYVGAVDAWVRTGTATQVPPPPGTPLPPVPWG